MNRGRRPGRLRASLAKRAAVALLTISVAAPSVAGAPGLFEAVQILPPAAGEAPSAAYSNASQAIDYLRSQGHTAEADQLKQLLDDGKIYFDPEQSENGDTSPRNNVTVRGGLIGATRSGRTSAFGDDRTGKADVISLARTLFHELVHVNQSEQFIMSSNAQALAGGEAYHETLAWNATVTAMRHWLERALQAYEDGDFSSTEERLAAAYEINDLLSNLRSYANSFTSENNYYGATGLAGNYDDLAGKLDAIEEQLGEDIDGMRNELAAGETARLCDEHCREEHATLTVADIRASDADRAAGEADQANQAAQDDLADEQEHHDDLERQYNQARADLRNATTTEQRMDAATRIGQLERPLRASSARLETKTQAASDAAAAAESAGAAAAEAHAAAAAARAAYEACVRDCLQQMLDEGAINDYALPAGASVDGNGRVQVGSDYGAGGTGERTTGTSTKPSYQNLIDDLKTNSLYSALPPAFGDPGGGNVFNASDIFAQPAAFNPISGVRDPVVQIMMLEGFDDVGQIPGSRMEPPPGGRSGRATITVPPAVSRSGPLLTLDPTATPGIWSWLGPGLAQPPAMLASLAPPVPQSGLQIALTSLGSSTGRAFTAQIFNFGRQPATLDAHGIVVEPLTEEAKRLMQQQLQRLARSSPLTAELNAYCLEFLRLPPKADSVYQIASSQLQERFAAARQILSVAGRLQQLGLLSPDSDPAGYFDFVKQWSLWTNENGWDVGSFTEAFVGHTKKLVEARGESWSAQIEGVLRDAAPGRWSDISRVLDAAGRR